MTIIALQTDGTHIGFDPLFAEGLNELLRANHAQALLHKENKVNKPYKHLQSQGQGHIKKITTVLASLMLIACYSS